MKGLKTFLVGALITFLGGIQAADLAEIVPAEYTGIVLSAIGVVVMVLRAITNTPIFKDTPAPEG